MPAVSVAQGDDAVRHRQEALDQRARRLAFVEPEPGELGRATADVEDEGAGDARIEAPAAPAPSVARARHSADQYAGLIEQCRDAIREGDAYQLCLTTRFQVAGNGGANSAFAAWVLKPWGERTRSQQQIQQEIQPRLDKVAGVQAFVFAIPSLPGTGGGLPVSFVVQSTEAADRVYEQAESIRMKAMQSGKFIIVQNSVSFDTPQVRVLIDRQRAAALGVSVADIGNTLTLLVGENARIRVESVPMFFTSPVTTELPDEVDDGDEEFDPSTFSGGPPPQDDESEEGEEAA